MTRAAWADAHVATFPDGKVYDGERAHKREPVGVGEAAALGRVQAPRGSCSAAPHRCQPVTAAAPSHLRSSCHALEAPCTLAV